MQELPRGGRCTPLAPSPASQPLVVCTSKIHMNSIFGVRFINNYYIHCKSILIFKENFVHLLLLLFHLQAKHTIISFSEEVKYNQVKR